MLKIYVVVIWDVNVNVLLHADDMLAALISNFKLLSVHCCLFLVC